MSQAERTEHADVVWDASQAVGEEEAGVMQDYAVAIDPQ